MLLLLTPGGTPVRWQPGQMLTITSAMHDMTAVQQRIVRVTTEYIDGAGHVRQTVEFGGLRLRLRSNGTTNTSGAGVQGDIG